MTKQSTQSTHAMIEAIHWYDEFRRYLRNYRSQFDDGVVTTMQLSMAANADFYATSCAKRCDKYCKEAGFDTYSIFTQVGTWLRERDNFFYCHPKCGG